MSSVAIYTQIMSCQETISVLEESIRLIQATIEEQEHVLSVAQNLGSIFLDECDDKQQKQQNVFGYTESVVLSSRMNDVADVEFGANKQSLTYKQVENANKAMKAEIATQIRLLQQQESNLKQARKLLNQLNIDYRNALAAEEAERQRVASAAQAGSRKA